MQQTNGYKSLFGINQFDSDVSSITNLTCEDATISNTLDLTGATVSGLDTSQVSEGSNLYFTTARFDTQFALKDTDDLTESATKVFLTPAEKTLISTNENDIGVNEVAIALNTDSIDDNEVAIGVNFAAIALNTAKRTYPLADENKVGFISVSQAVDLDQMEIDVAANNAKISYTDAAAVALNTAKISYTDAAAVALNTAKISYTDAAQVATNASELDTLDQLQPTYTATTNTWAGNSALGSHTSTGSNDQHTVFGYEAMAQFDDPDGTQNACFGWRAGYEMLENCYNNTLIGSQAGVNMGFLGGNVNGNTCIGKGAGFDSVSNYKYSIAIGSGAKIAQNYECVIGQSGTTNDTNLIRAGQDSTCDLGSTSYKFKDLYLSNDIDMEGDLTVKNIIAQDGSLYSIGSTGTRFNGLYLNGNMDTNGLITGGDLHLKETGGGADYVGITAPASVTTYSLTLPSAVATAASSPLVSSTGGVLSYGGTWTTGTDLRVYATDGSSHTLNSGGGIRYMVLGKTCFFYARVQWASNNTMTGSLDTYVASLPYTAADHSFCDKTPISIAEARDIEFLPSNVQLEAWIPRNTNHIYLGYRDYSLTAQATTRLQKADYDRTSGGILYLSGCYEIA